MEYLVSAINKTLWGAPMLLLLLGAGTYFSVRLKLFQLFRVREWMRESVWSLFRKKEKTDGISPYRALSAALAATVGSGNVVGVATAIAAGGAGAVFWMWVSAFFGMATKYAEIYLAVRFRRKNGDGFYGGPMYYIENGLGKGWKWLGVLFAFSGALACLGMGAMNQSNSISGILLRRLHVSPLTSGIILAVIAAGAISGGIKKISRITEGLVPLMALLYVGVGVAIILSNPVRCISSLAAIFKGAFNIASIAGGVTGTVMKNAVRFGFARGVFSNEAGLGSSPIIHATADAKSPQTQGFWGVFEVFADTFVVCTVTALVIITGTEISGEITGAELVSLAFSNHLGAAGSAVVEVSTILFALTTVLGWSYYGESCLYYLAGENESSRNLYRVAFCFAVFLGAVLNVKF
ncbi:MAG: sodium:alanine symporter family protein, partial [Oscillospiraceae bacterium]|nr:sodium:alanine symporter family protein [Oscillospiraceae bacterium]